MYSNIIYMSSKLISSLLKRINPKKDAIDKTITNKDQDEDINELKSL